MTRKEVLDALLEGTHSLWTPEFVDDVNAAFGTRIGCRTYRASPDHPKGLTLDSNAKSAVGLDSPSIATALCHHFGVKYESRMGRGFQVQECVRSLIASGKVVL